MVQLETHTVTLVFTILKTCRLVEIVENTRETLSYMLKILYNSSLTNHVVIQHENEKLISR